MGLLPTGGERPSVLVGLSRVLRISRRQSLFQQQPAGPGPVARSILYSLIQFKYSEALFSTVPSTPFSSWWRQQLRAGVLEVRNEP